MEYKSPRGKDARRKAEFFGSFAHEHGWSGKWSRDDESGETHLFCRRGENETLDIWWQANGCIMPGLEPVYTLAGERIRLRNLSAASKVVQSRPNQDRLRKAARKRNRKTGIEFTTGDFVDPEVIAGLQSSLPFDAESGDDEIEAVLHRRTITWVNRISGEVDGAFVNADKQFRVVRMPDDPDKDQVHFCDVTRGGYRAVYLKSIVSVG